MYLWWLTPILMALSPTVAGANSALVLCGDDIHSRAQRRIENIAPQERARSADAGAFAETLERFADFNIQKSFERLGSRDRIVIAGAGEAQLAYEYLTHSGNVIECPFMGRIPLALPPPPLRAKVQGFDFFPLSDPLRFQPLIEADKFEFMGGKLLKDLDDKLFVGASMVICEFGPTSYVPDFSQTIPRYLSWLKRGGELYVAFERNSVMVKTYADAQGKTYVRPIEEPLGDVLTEFYRGSEGVRFESAAQLFGHPFLKFTILDETKVTAPRLVIDTFEPRENRNLPPRIIFRRAGQQ